MTSGRAWRFSVVGTTGAGKTTTARRIAQRLEIPHVELDALYWGPEWSPASLPVFRTRVADAVRDEAWVVDGNYSKVRDIVWRRADVVVWLDYELPVILRQLVCRTLRRCVRQEELWNGNRETLREAFFSRKSIVLWALRTYRRRRKEYSALFQGSDYAHLSLMRLTSPRSTRRWVANLTPSRMA